MPKRPKNTSGAGGDVDLTASIQASFEGSPSPNNRFQGLGQDASDDLPPFTFRSRTGDAFAFLDDEIATSLQAAAQDNLPNVFLDRFTNLDQDLTPAVYQGGESLLPPWYDPTSDKSPYRQFQTRKRGIFEDVANDYVLGGRTAEIGSLTFKDSYQDRLVSTGMMLPMESEPIGEYSAWKLQRKIITDQIADEYAADGRGHLVGTESFRNDVTRNMVDAGMMPEEAPERATWRSRLKESFSGMGGAFGLGYAAAAAGHGIGQYEALNNGAYYTPEDREARLSGAVVPGISMIAGTAIGGLVAGEAGALGGQFIGQGVGEIINSGVEANMERGKSTRETSELLVTQLGAATDKVREFSAALTEAGAPIKEIQTAFTTLASAGPGLNGASSIAGVAQLSDVLGERFNPALSGATSFLSRNPILAPALTGFSGVGGDESPSQLGNYSTVAAFMGDFKGSNDFLTLQEGAAASPQRAKDSDFLRRELAEDPAEIEYERLFFRSRWNAAESAASRLASPDPRSAEARAQTVQQRNKAFELFTRSQAGEALSQANVGAATASLSLADLSGASDAQMASIAEGVYGAVKGAVPGLTGLISGIDKYVSDTPGLTDVQKAQLEAVQAQARATLSSNDVTSQQTRRSLFERSVGTEESDFAYWQNRDRLAGWSPRDMASGYGSQASYYEDLANDSSSPLRPAERSKLRMSADTLRYQSGEDIFAYDTGQVSIAGADLEADLGGAVRTGSFADVARARRRIAGNDLQQVFLDQQRIAQGVDWQEQQRLQVEMARLTDEAGQTNYQAGIDRYEGERSNQQYIVSDPGMSRRVRLMGNAGITPDDLSSIRGLIDIDRGEVARNTDPKRRAMLDDRLQGDIAQLDERTDLSRVYRDPASVSNRLYSDETDFELARLSPWAAGPDANPWQRGMSVERDYQGRITRRNADRTTRLGRGDWDDIAQGSYQEADRADRLQVAQLEHERMYAMYDAVPEMLGGSPGGGIGAAVINPAAISAWFNPSPVAGGFGRTPGQQAAIAPGASAGFMAAAATKGDAAQTTNNLLQQILTALTTGRGINAGGHPGQDATGVANMFLGKTFDPLMPR